MPAKIELSISVLEAAQARISKAFDLFSRLYISFSGGKDSSVMFHLVAAEAKKRGRKFGVLIIDLEAQYAETIKHLHEMVEMYADIIDLHWVCPELLLRNAVSNYQPRWVCWDETKKENWIREKPKLASDLSQYDFYVPKMEFEEFMVIFGEWYCQGVDTGAFIGIRSDESLHRYRAIVARKEGLTIEGHKWTTQVSKRLWNLYPIYDCRVEDIWVFHGKKHEFPYNRIYSQMTTAGVKLSLQRLCQPYGDDQRRGLWLYHILEPDTWYKLVARVNGANSGAMYVQESGNISGYNYITKPDGHTWQSFCNLLLSTMPGPVRNHYAARFKKFIAGWKNRGYQQIPDEAPHELEVKCWAPSWRRMCKVILRNDYWCKGMSFTQTKSDAYNNYLKLIEKKKEKWQLHLFQ
jgi:predicted phosphoadenosine phosphosulfate sulfurtransferase